ncbi:unnamed protein product [Strongylus vulgaris]|uniref:Uncharacterized protein n=1 Tax=Strongylus vulgaris TaxID=40348 RepID=A0A3P7INW6_STRVU|nr:unnamed protein product [Strongylus vulgaris]
MNSTLILMSLLISLVLSEFVDVDEGPPTHPMIRPHRLRPHHHKRDINVLKTQFSCTIDAIELVELSAIGICGCGQLFSLVWYSSKPYSHASYHSFVAYAVDMDNGELKEQQCQDESEVDCKSSFGQQPIASLIVAKNTTS